MSSGTKRRNPVGATALGLFLFFIASSALGAEKANSWYIDAKGMKMSRQDRGATTLIGHSGSGPYAPGEEIQNTSDVINTGHGGRLAIGYWWDSKQALEIAGMGIVNRGDKTVIDLDPGGQDINLLFCSPFVFGACTIGGLAGFAEFDQAARVRVEYDSDLIGGGLNYRRRVNRYWSWLAGIRYAYLGEKLELTVDDGGGGPVPFSDTAVYGIRTRNHLFGSQLGVNAYLPMGHQVQFSFMANGGLFFNHAETLARAFDDDGLSIQSDNTKNRVAGLLESSLVLAWNPMPDLTVSAGYNVLYIPGVSTAPDQFARNNTSAEFTKNVSGYALYHGPMLRFVLKN